MAKKNKKKFVFAFPPSNTQSYEGILQLRNPSLELLQFVKNQIRKSKVEVIKLRKLKQGYDLQLSSKKFLEKLARQFNNKFPGLLKTSHQLYSQHKLTSKRISRLTVFFYHFPLKKGDIFSYQGGKYLVLAHTNTQVQVKEVNSGQKRSLHFEDLINN